jgi:isoleucyl-tRNA synthetase
MSQGPVLAAKHVTSESGTGLVHTAPAHGPDDYAAWRANNQTGEIVCPVDSEGKFTDAIGNKWSRLVGKEVLGDGNIEVIRVLKEAGLLVKKEAIRHRYPYDWKTKMPVIFRFVVILCYSYLGKLIQTSVEQHLNGSQIWIQ